MKVRIGLSNKQNNIVRQECLKEFNKLLRFYNNEAVIQLLYVLRFEYGFGQKRLEEFTEKFTAMQRRTIDHYEMTEKDTAWLCRLKLEESGIDLSTLIRTDDILKD